MSPPHQIAFEFRYDTPALARTVERSIVQEIGEIEDERSSTSVSREGLVLRICLEAADLTALRAAANTWLTLTAVAERTADKAGVFGS